MCSHAAAGVWRLPAAIDTALVQAGFKGSLGAPNLTAVLHRLLVQS